MPSWRLMCGLEGVVETCATLLAQVPALQGGQGASPARSRQSAVLDARRSMVIASRQSRMGDGRKSVVLGELVPPRRICTCFWECEKPAVIPTG